MIKRKEKMKKENGVTLIALVVTIIVLLILAGISIKVGTQNIKEAKNTSVLAEVSMVQHAALERYTKETMTGNNHFPGVQKYTSMDQIKNEILQLKNDAKLLEILENTKESVSDYYYLQQEDIEELGITKSESSYIINYKLGIVINVTTQITGNGESVYVYAKDGME